VLSATTENRVGGARMRSTLVLERAVRGTVVQRDALAFDTRFAAASLGPPEPVGHVFLLLAGRLIPDGGAPLPAPLAFVLADDEVERIGARSRTFRTDGERVRVIQLRLDEGHLCVPVGLDAGPLALPDACWDAAAMLDARAAEGTSAPLARLLEALAAAGAVTDDVPGSLCADEPERFQRLWQALQPLYETYGLTASLKQIASSLDMSMRQVGRDAKELAATFGVGPGYREALRVLRLRVAAVLLAAPEGTVVEVARQVGYGSSIAMARAFRDANLPAPSVIQAALRGG